MGKAQGKSNQSQLSERSSKMVDLAENNFNADSQACSKRKCILKIKGKCDDNDSSNREY